MIDSSQLLERAVEMKASDIFITVGVPPTFKIDGKLVPLEHPVLNPEDTEEFAKSLFKREEHYKEFLENGDKDFSVSLKGVGRYRVVVYNQRGSFAVAIRVLSFIQDEPEDLRIPQSVLNFHRRTKGLVLITAFTKLYPVVLYSTQKWLYPPPLRNLILIESRNSSSISSLNQRSILIWYRCRMQLP